jgi:hypothetical protein
MKKPRASGVESGVKFQGPQRDPGAPCREARPRAARFCRDPLRGQVLEQRVAGHGPD